MISGTRSTVQFHFNHAPSRGALPICRGNSDPLRSRYRSRRISKTFFEPRPRVAAVAEYQKKRAPRLPTGCPGSSRLRQLPSRRQRSARHLPFPHLNRNISCHPRVPSTLRPAHPRPCVSFRVPCHAPLPLPLFFPMAQATVKGQAAGAKASQQVSVFSVLFSHAVVCERCSYEPCASPPWSKMGCYIAKLAAQSVWHFALTQLRDRQPPTLS